MGARVEVMQNILSKSRGDGGGGTQKGEMQRGVQRANTTTAVQPSKQQRL